MGKPDGRNALERHTGPVRPVWKPRLTDSTGSLALFENAED
jgi:hypothetical protein